MSRVKSSVSTRKKRQKILKLAKGYRGRSSTCYRIANGRVEKGLQYAYRDRRTKKRDFRSLWIKRINAAARNQGITYSLLMSELKKNNILINRKVLSDICINQSSVFNQIINKYVSRKSFDKETKRIY